MQSVAQAFHGINLPSYNVSTDDNIMSSVYIDGSFDAKENWPGGFFQNSRFFQAMVTPSKGKRYYDDGDRVTLTLTSASHKLTNRKLRKYTATPEKVAAKLREWIEGNR